MIKVTRIKESGSQTNTNHVFCCDVSWSMDTALDKLRVNLKNNLTLMINDGDTLSIIYFGSKGQYGVLFENQEIKSLNDLTSINQAIDRFLVPIGCTGFKEPIDEAVKLTARLDSGKLNSLTFMTDGYENQWSNQQVLDSASKLRLAFDNISFIEYGYYCNRELLTQMANVSGGNLIFSEDYNSMESTVTTSLSSQSNGTIIASTANLIMYVTDGIVYQKEPLDGSVRVPYGVDVYEFNEITKEDDDITKYLYLYHVMDKGKDVLSTLKVLGDVRLINLFGSCFTKQDKSEFLDEVKGCILDESKRFQDGLDYDLIPKDDATTVLDILNILVEGNNKLCVDSKDFSYNRITANTKTLTKEEKIEDLKQSIINETNMDVIQEIGKSISDLEDNVKFVSTDKHVNIKSLTFNSTRPNISLSTVLNGYVEIPESKQSQYGLPNKIPSTKNRTYNIIKDGIKNLKLIPVILEKKTFNKLKEISLFDGNFVQGKEYLIDLGRYPLINRDMTKKGVNAKYLGELTLDIMLEKGKEKALKDLYETSFGKKTSIENLTKYGENANKYLLSIGVTDSSFNPKSSTVKSKDYYMTKELSIKVKGASTIPSINALNKKINEGKKLNLGDKILSEGVDYYKEFTKDEVDKELKTISRKRKSLELVSNIIVYAIVIGRVWFEDLDVDEDTVQLDYKGYNTSVKFVLEEKKINI